jgi:hypothetical protein
VFQIERVNGTGQTIVISHRFSRWRSGTMWVFSILKVLIKLLIRLIRFLDNPG